jgi:Anthrone oxygenase
MSLVADVLRWLSVASLGIFAGAMLTEGGVLVPFWRALPPEEFLRWYAANAQRLLRFFSPVTSAGALLAVLAAAASFFDGHPGRWWALLAAGLVLMIVTSFFVYFEHANARFAAATIAPTDVPAELARWSTWHNARTVLSLAALGAALLAVRQP